jgi:cell division protein FtsL
MTDDEIGTLWAERNALRSVYEAAEVFVDMPRLVTESALRDAVTTFRAERDAQHAIYTALHDALVIAEGQRDQLRAERDALRNEWSGLLIEQARLMALRDEAIAERDALKAELAKVPTLGGALFIPCNSIEVQP